jgi:uncharacterized membrane protein
VVEYWTVEIETTVEIDSPPDRVWRVMIDVERWPEWTRSIDSVRLLDGQSLAVGARARIKQPRVPALTWKVTELTPERGFVWQTRGIGFDTVGSHTIEPSGGGSRVTLNVKQTGVLSKLMPWIKAMSRRYIDIEAQGLKTRSEELSHST